MRLDGKMVYYCGTLRMRYFADAVECGCSRIWVECSRMRSDVFGCDYIQLDLSKSVRKRSDAAEYGRIRMALANSN